MKVKTQSKKVNKAWLNEHVNDPYVRQAQKDGFRARAAYKLKEIDESLGLVKPGMAIVDLGSTPGAWSQYLRRRLSPQGAAVGELDGAIIALDLLPMEPVEGVQFIQGDFREEAVLNQLLAMLGWTSAPGLPFLKKDTLIMMGDADQIVPLANGHILKTLIPNSRLEVFEGGGHLFMLSQREKFVASMRAFLDDDAA